MIKIKNFKESFVASLKYKSSWSNASSYVEIFKNPTYSELQEISLGFQGFIRATIFYNGDIYTATPQSEILHDDLVSILFKVKILKNNYNDWFTYPKSNKIFINIAFGKDRKLVLKAESYQYKIDIDLLEHYSNILKKKGFNIEYFFLPTIEGKMFQEKNIHRFVKNENFKKDKILFESSENVKVSFLRKIDEFDIWIVDGNKIRSEVEIEFCLGGNGFRYSFIPKNEIWIEENISDIDDAEAIIAHEIVETRLMRDQKLDYDSAHQKASDYEEIVRKMD
jgi:hypothetical protein